MWLGATFGIALILGNSIAGLWIHLSAIWLFWQLIKWGLRIDRVERQIKRGDVDPKFYKELRDIERSVLNTIKREKRREPRRGRELLPCIVCSAPSVDGMYCHEHS